jgi:hypothetical protein
LDLGLVMAGCPPGFLQDKIKAKLGGQPKL